MEGVWEHSIFAVGLDWETASLEQREACLRTMDTSRLAGVHGLRGWVLLQTCSRLELYFEGDSALPAELFGEGAGLFRLEGEPACRRLLEIACGLRSQILGEEQILTQVRSAADQAREAGTMTPELETLFRLAVTAGKAVRTQVRFRPVSSSAAHKAVTLAGDFLGGLAEKRALVIGSGEMGRLAAGLLARAGCRVRITLRSCRRVESIIPAGCEPVPYARRQEAMEGCDLLISATRSPHFTVTASMLKALEAPPAVIVDVALPRDVEPACRELPGVRLWDLDDLRESSQDVQALQAAERVVEEQLAELERWRRGREGRPAPARFPLFISLEGRPCLVVGGGPVGLRRCRALAEFGARVTLIDPVPKALLQGVRQLERRYRSGDAAGMTLAVAASNDPEVNRQVGEECRALGIPVSVADSPEACTFFFPAICRSEHLSAGVVSQGDRHTLTVQAAKAVRKALSALDGEVSP